MFKTTWKTEYKGHVIELENRIRLERLIVDGKEIARQPGATWEPRSFQATIPDGNRSMKVDANTRFSKSPRGLRFTVSVDGKEIYSEVKWPPRWYLPFAAAAHRAAFRLANAVVDLPIQPSLAVDERGSADGGPRAEPSKHMEEIAI